MQTPAELQRELRDLQHDIDWHEANVKRMGSVISSEEVHYLKIRLNTLQGKIKRATLFADAKKINGQPVNIFHQCDTNAPKPDHVWHFVYLHALAEQHNEDTAKKNNYWSDKDEFDDSRPWAAPDCFVADQPMPIEEGDYQGFLYGLAVVIFVRKRFNLLGGRAACVDDPEGFDHASKPDDWR